jgi:hypothetical protein
MKRFARALAVMLGIVVLGFVILLVPQKNATATGGAPVNIMSPLPLPVTGNVNAAVAGMVGEQQSGSWNVGVSNFPGTLTGATAPVSGNVNASVTFPPNPANEPFQGVLCSGAGVSSGLCTNIGFPGVIHVPTTATGGAVVKRLVIEYVNALCDEQAGSELLFFTLQTTVNENIATGQPGAKQTYYFVPQFAAGNNYILGVSAPTQLYADPGTDIPIALGNATITVDCVATVSGHLVTQ